MRTSIARSAVVAFGVASALIWSGTVSGQWLKYPTAGVPKTADGKPNLAARTPRTPDGKPDFSGIWLTDNTLCFEPQNPESLTCGSELPMGKDGINMGASLPGGLPYQPWLAALVKKRTAENAKDDPHVFCLPDTFVRAYSLPHLLKFVQTPGLLVMLNEMNAGYRQVFTDGRPLPADMVPSWQGYSTAKWEDRHARRELGRIPRRHLDRLERQRHRFDRQGAGTNPAARLRPSRDRGHGRRLKAYTKPWTVTLRQRLALNTELVDEICLENEKSSQRMK